MPSKKQVIASAERTLKNDQCPAVQAFYQSIRPYRGVGDYRVYELCKRELGKMVCSTGLNYDLYNKLLTDFLFV